jgi:hypothetical protein
MTITKAAFRSGLLVFLAILILLFTKAGSFVIIAIYLAPGLAFGLGLTSAVKNQVSAFSSIFFVLLSMAINIFCVYYVSNDFLDLDYGHYASIKSVICSAIGAAALTMGFDFIILRRFSVIRSIVMPSILGIASSLLSAFFMYLLISGKYNEFESAILWIGMLSIFPLWQYLIGLNIDYHCRAIYQARQPDPVGNFNQKRPE